MQLVIIADASNLFWSSVLELEKEGMDGKDLDKLKFYPIFISSGSFKRKFIALTRWGYCQFKEEGNVIPDAITPDNIELVRNVSIANPVEDFELDILRS